MFGNDRLGVYCCGHVFRQQRRVLLVSHEKDGDWQFVCGKGDHTDPNEPYHLSIGVLIAHDPSLHEVSDLPIGCEAERSTVGDSWIRTKEFNA